MVFDRLAFASRRLYAAIAAAAILPPTGAVLCLIVPIMVILSIAATASKAGVALARQGVSGRVQIASSRGHDSQFGGHGACCIEVRLPGAWLVARRDNHSHSAHIATSMRELIQ